MLINVKMSKIVGILTFMSRINFMCSAEMSMESFITSGPSQQLLRIEIRFNTRFYQRVVTLKKNHPTITYW